MAAALIKILPTDLRRKVQKREQEAVRAGTTLAGRQVAFLIYEYFKTEDHMSIVYGYNDVSDLEWLGDRKKQEFCDLWDHIMDNLEEELSSKAKRDLFARQIAKSEDLREDYAHFKRLDKFDKKKNFRKG